MSDDDTNRIIKDLDILNNRHTAINIALKIAEINRTAEVQKILADAKRILSFYEKGPVE
jgi:hypothetical protein